MGISDPYSSRSGIFLVYSWYICGLINEMRNFIEQSCLDHVTTGSPPTCSAIELLLREIKNCTVLSFIYPSFLPISIYLQISVWINCW